VPSNNGDHRIRCGDSRTIARAAALHATNPRATCAARHFTRRSARHIARGRIDPVEFRVGEGCGYVDGSPAALGAVSRSQVCAISEQTRADDWS
jgi:hypothetical protein